jgi:hypothetical protein
VAGFTEGTLQLYRLDGTSAPTSYSFVSTPASPVLRIIPGPPGTVIAGFADGTVGIWNLGDGYLLDSRRLFGPIATLFLHGALLQVASEVGDARVIDISIFYTDYCTVLSRVWNAIPVVWETGHARTRPPPGDHPCRSMPK